MSRELEKLMVPHGQRHLLAHWPRLTDVERQSLERQICAVDFQLLKRLAGGEGKVDDWAALSARARSPRAIRLGRSDNAYSADAARRRGEAALRAGEIGAVLVAGGQGTRLGFPHPKGMYQIGPVSNATLFQILIEKLLAAGRRHGVRIPLFLMTSPATHDETLEFLAAHDRFGLPADDLVVICQGTMPAVDEQTGRVLLESPSELALSPDGHGGLVEALARSTAPQLVCERGLRHLFYFQVDNPLAGVCDPEFIGYHLLSASEVSTQVVAKRDPAERVGVVVDIDGRTQIIEYSDLPAVDAARRQADGSLELWAGNIAVHVFDAGFLLRAAERADALPFHVARKKVPFVDAAGQVVQPEQPNALKFERFIFDLLPLAKQTLVVEIDPAIGFAPVKNAPGSKIDSPETARAAMIAQDTRRLEAFGVKIAPGTPVEISPLASLDAEKLAGQVIDQPKYLT